MILNDLLMPGLDGLSVLRNLREREELDEVPVLIVSSHDKPDVIVKAINAGANDFIRKPYAVEDVLDRLRIHLREKSR
jgi:DNA-binding response OmpR family regulator